MCRDRLQGIPHFIAKHLAYQQQSKTQCTSDVVIMSAKFLRVEIPTQDLSKLLCSCCVVAMWLLCSCYVVAMLLLLAKSNQARVRTRFVKFAVLL